jgi:uncharacterized membrane protein
MSPRLLNLAASFSLLALIVLCVLWETWLAPLRPGGSWMMLKALPLLPAVFGILRGRRYTHQWVSMLSLLYLSEGVLRISDAGLSAILAGGEVALAVLLFFSTMLYARNTAPSRQAPGRAESRSVPDEDAPR